MKYNQNQVDGIKHFIESITMVDMMDSEEFVYGLGLVLKKKLLHSQQKEQTDLTEELIKAKKTAAHVCFTTTSNMDSRTRRAQPVMARRILAWYMRRYHGISDNGIAKWINKHRTSAVYFVDTSNDEYTGNRDFREAMLRFCQKMNIEYKPIVNDRRGYNKK